MLAAMGQTSSWDFASGTVAWLRKRGYVAPKGDSPPSVLLFTEAGRQAYARGAS